jgi:hypothetical protein
VDAVDALHAVVSNDHVDAIGTKVVRDWARYPVALDDANGAGVAIRDLTRPLDPLAFERVRVEAILALRVARGSSLRNVPAEEAAGVSNSTHAIGPSDWRL